MQTETTHRALIGGAGVAAMSATIAAASTPSGTITSIERSWHDRREAYREFDGDPLVLEDDEHARRYWDRIDAAEAAILASSDNSPRAVEIRLWTAWSHTDRAMAYAITQGDVATLRSRFADFDWHEKMLFAAILALRGEARA